MSNKSEQAKRQTRITSGQTNSTSGQASTTS